MGNEGREFKEKSYEKAFKVLVEFFKSFGEKDGNSSEFLCKN